VIVDDLHVESIGHSPHEAHAPPVVDPNAVLTLPPALELLEAVAWRNAKVLKRSRGVQEQQLPPGDTLKSAKTRDVSVVKKIVHHLRAKGPNHRRIISFNGNRYKRMALAGGASTAKVG
jgi:hypothetical protein